MEMNSSTFSPGPLSSWFPIIQADPSPNSSFWSSRNVHDQLNNLRDVIDTAKAMQKELEAICQTKEISMPVEKVDDDLGLASVQSLSKVINEKRISLEVQESHSLEATNTLISNLRSQLEPFNVLLSQTSSWEQKSAAIRLADKIHKHKRNKLRRKKKRKHNAEMFAKERERFDQADQEADEWRAREIAKDIAKRKVEKMKEIAKLKANEGRKKLESELELVLIVEKLQELRSIRIQKLKKQGHFLPEEDDKFLERVRAAVEEEERQAAAAADTDATKDAIATAEDSRKTIQNSRSDTKDTSGSENGVTKSQGQPSETEKEAGSTTATKPEYEQGLRGQTHGGTYESVENLPLEFYHYYHGSNTDMGTLIEVRRTWDAYIRPGGSRIPGHWVQSPPPANEIWASYLVKNK